MKWFKGGNSLFQPADFFKFDKPRCKFEYVVILITVFGPQIFFSLVEKDIMAILNIWSPFYIYSLIIGSYVVIRLWIIDEDFRNFVKKVIKKIRQITRTN